MNLPMHTATMKRVSVISDRLCVVDLTPCDMACPSCRGELSLPKKEKKDRDEDRYESRR